MVVEVAAAAVNFPDVLLVADRYQFHVPVPFTPGSEFAGTVVAVGPEVKDLSVGDRVMGATLIGGFAERIAVPASVLEVGGAVGGSGHRRRLRRGPPHRVPRPAQRGPRPAGGVGGGARGGRRGGAGRGGAGAPCSGRGCWPPPRPKPSWRCAATKGAPEVVDYTTEDLKERIKEITGGGADVVIDPVGGAWAEAALRALRWGGRFVSVGFASGEIPRIPLNLVLLKGVVVTGFTMEGMARNQPDDVARDEAELRQLLATGEVVPHVSARYSLDGAAQALRELAERRATGKILVEPGA